MSPSESGGDRPPLAPPFFATEPPTAPARSSRQETPAPQPGITGADETSDDSAGFPWEAEQAADEAELVLGDVVEAREPDAGEMVLTEIVETAEHDESGAGPGGFPEEAIIRPDSEPAEVQGPKPVSSVHDPEAAAERLEQLARRIRHGGPEGLAQLVAASDRFEAVVAAVVAGYFAGLHDRRQ